MGFQNDLWQEFFIQPVIATYGYLFELFFFPMLEKEKYPYFIQTQVVSYNGSGKFYVFLPIWGLNFQHTWIK